MIKAMLEQELGLITEQEFRTASDVADKEILKLINDGIFVSLYDALNIISTCIDVVRIHKLSA